MGFFEKYDLLVWLAGLGVLGIATLLHRFADRPFSFPIAAVALGFTAYALPLGLPPLQPVTHGPWILHLTELGVILSLMGVGLKIDRLPHPRSWTSTWLLLGIAMPLCIAGAALLGWGWLGLAPASALLLGAVLAPTDPVLASDVQVGEPEENTRNVHPAEQEDELRFTLTSEAGLNDALAFPFVYLAMALLAPTAGVAWFQDWLLWDVAYRLVVGMTCGAIIGLGLAAILLRLPVSKEHERMRTGLGALAAALLLYGATEALAGYGFLAVFIGGLVIRHYETTHQSHRSLHVFAEQAEQLLMTVILIGLGAAIASGVLAPLTWQAALLVALIVFLLRPLAGMLALGFSRRMGHLDRLLTSVFGIRGIGTLFYLAYALQKHSFPQQELLWAICAFAILLSVCVHGVTASPAMLYRARRPAASRTDEANSVDQGLSTDRL